MGSEPDFKTYTHEECDSNYMSSNSNSDGLSGGDSGGE